MPSFRIGDHPVGPDSETYVIAEAGLNHDGEYDRAELLVDVAADAGADAVKFQTFTGESLYGESSDLADAFADVEMPHDWIPRLADYAADRGIAFMSSPFDRDAADALDPHVPAFKLASSTLSDHGFLRYVAGLDKPVVISTGMHDLDEVEAAVSVLEEAGTNVVVLHCVSAYPTPLSGINVRMMSSLRDRLGVPVGLSDHTTDPVTAPAAATALGASVVEKHITDDSSREGGDHAMALEPNELTVMVEAIRKTETALGSREKTVVNAERDAYDASRRSIYATDRIAAGDPITETNTAVLRPGDRDRGLDPSALKELLDREATTVIEQDEPVTWRKVAGNK